MYRTLAKRLVAHDDAAFVILKCTGYDFAGRSRPFVYQHNQRHGLQRGRQRFQRIGTVSTLVKLRRSLEREFAFGKLAIGRHHGHIFGQESGRNGYSSVQQTAWIVAQIQHKSFEVGFLFVDLVYLNHEIVHGTVLKLAQANPSIARLDDFSADGLGANFLANNRYWKRPAFIFAKNGQRNLGFWLPAHFLHSFVEAESLDCCVVNAGDQVVGFESRPVSWRAFDGRHHLDQAVFLADFNADADKSPGSAFAKFFIRFFVEVHGMRI